MKNVIRVTLAVLSAVCISTTWAAAETGAELYKAKCALCHGTDGKGTAVGKKMGAQDLTSPEAQKQSDADLTTVIVKGKNKMPPYDGKLTKEQVELVLKHIRTLK